MKNLIHLRFYNETYQTERLNRSNMRTILYIIWQCTWGFLQTALGFIVFLAHFKEKHYLYHGAIITGWENRASVSLGLFVFIARESKCNGVEKNDDPLSELSERLLIHEYGHTIQSLMLGPLYLIIIGIPSALWCSLPYCKKKRKDKRISYYSFYTEKWADLLGERVVKSSAAPRR